jgi:uncharacterized GH25 family protein
MRSAPFALLAVFLLSSIGRGAPQPPTGPTMTIQVNDKATGDPIPQANVSAGNERTTTDDYGQCSLVVQERGRYFNVRVTKPGYVAMGADWRNLEPKQKLPDQLTFNMEPGTSMGGKVVDESGKPVSGATVELIAPENGTHKEGEVRSQFQAEAHTNDSGMWSINTAPADASMVDYQVRASGYFTDQVYRNFPSVADLRNRSATLTIQHAVNISGKVFDPSGKPVANADVTAGEEGWGGVRHRARTNDTGEFTLSGLRPGTVAFAVMADNYAPQLVSSVAPATQPAEIHLSAGTPMKFHVVDSAGKPLTGVEISVDQWRNASYMDYSMRTNTDGNATWAGAPADEVQMSFTKRRYGSIVQRPITATTQPIQITLGPKTKIIGTVTDAATGAAISDFTVQPGIIWQNSDQTYWVNPNDGWGGDIKAGDGHFTYAPTQPYPQYQLCVQAAGYLPSDSAPFNNDAGDLPLAFKLVKGVGVAGTVFGADHKPLADATMHMVLGNRPLQLQSHGNIQDWGQTVTPVQTDAQGHFGFAPQLDAFALVCATPDGYARLDAPALHPEPAPPGVPELAELQPATRPSSYDLILQPWGTVQGKLMIGSKPGAHVELGLQRMNARWNGRQPQVLLDYTLTTDSSGRFTFDHIPPGKILVAKVFRMANSVSFSAAVSVDVKPGETASVSMGGTGQPIVGKITIPSSFPHNWTAGIASLRPHMTNLKGPDMPLSIRLGSAEAKRKWYADWVKTPEGNAFMAAQTKAMQNGWTNIAFVVQPDSTFHIDDVPAGTYDMFMQFYPDDVMRSGTWDHPLGTVQKQIVIPAMPGGRSDEPLDVGTIPVSPPPTMQ